MSQPPTNTPSNDELRNLIETALDEYGHECEVNGWYSPRRTVTLDYIMNAANKKVIEARKCIGCGVGTVYCVNCQKELGVLKKERE